MTRELERVLVLILAVVLVVVLAVVLVLEPRKVDEEAGNVRGAELEMWEHVGWKIQEGGREKRGIRIKDVDTDPIISTGDIFMCEGGRKKLMKDESEKYRK